jgi:hypothetical protein
MNQTNIPSQHFATLGVKQSLQGLSIEGLQEVVDEAHRLMGDNVPALQRDTAWMYIPHPCLSNYLDKLAAYLAKPSPEAAERQAAGYLLEQIAFLTFRGIRGSEKPKSFQSAGPQYDLLCVGHTEQWFKMCDILSMDRRQRKIVVEVKAIDSPVNDQQFARLCNLMDLNLFKSAGLGIFFTLNGASGFPKRGSAKQRSVSDARLRQLLNHAKTGKSIVVFDQDDILQLNRNGSLLDLLIEKIEELSDVSGYPTLPLDSLEAVRKSRLPMNLREVYDL